MLIPTWPIAAACLVGGVLLGAGADHLWMASEVADLTATLAKERADNKEVLRVREVQRAADERTARDNERQLVEVNQMIEQDKTNEIARIRTDSAAAIARLQNRPDRQSARPGGAASQAPACQGATGAELSRSDAIFLDGEATRADEQRAALSACYRAYDAVP